MLVFVLVVRFLFLWFGFFLFFWRMGRWVGCCIGGVLFLFLVLSSCVCRLFFGSSVGPFLWCCFIVLGLYCNDYEVLSGV